MVNEILTASGIPHRQGRFPKPPEAAYVVYFDDITTDGPDGMPPRIFTHSTTLELYAPKPDEAATSALEAAMDARGVLWNKQDWLWIQSEQLFQTIYEFTYITKT